MANVGILSQQTYHPPSPSPKVWTPKKGKKLLVFFFAFQAILSNKNHILLVILGYTLCIYSWGWEPLPPPPPSTPLAIHPKFDQFQGIFSLGIFKCLKGHLVPRVSHVTFLYQRVIPGSLKTVPYRQSTKAQPA